MFLSLPDVSVHRSLPSVLSISKSQSQDPSSYCSLPPKLPPKRYPKPPKLLPKPPKVAPKPPKAPLRNQVQVVKSVNLTSSSDEVEPSKETKNTLLQQIKITHLQEDNARLQKEVACLQQDNALLKQKTNELQSQLEQRPRLGSDVDISFWVVSHKEMQTTEKELGIGGWGRVVVGSFRGQEVAIKELHEIISSSAHYKDLFRREISLMAKVRHPNLLLFIAAVLDSPSNVPAIITELMDTNLRQAYRTNQLKNGCVKLNILRDVSAALNYLHLLPSPIIHRDVSSANVLLQALPNDKWRGKLSDFGSANLVQHATTPGPGAMVYAAPEAFKEEQQSPKMDTYSFGKLLCEVFNNCFPDPSAFLSMLQSMAKDWPLMHQLISSCVEQNPNKRPAMSYIVDQLNHLTIQQK